MLRNAIGSLARSFWAVCQRKKRADRVQREHQLTAVADKGQPVDVPARPKRR
jgi:hypothetical protein